MSSVLAKLIEEHPRLVPDFLVDQGKYELAEGLQELFEDKLVLTRKERGFEERREWPLAFCRRHFLEWKFRPIAENEEGPVWLLEMDTTSILYQFHMAHRCRPAFRWFMSQPLTLSEACKPY